MTQWSHQVLARTAGTWAGWKMSPFRMAVALNEDGKPVQRDSEGDTEPNPILNVDGPKLGAVTPAGQQEAQIS